MQGEKASSLLDFWEACGLQDWLCCWSPPPGGVPPRAGMERACIHVQRCRQEVKPSPNPPAGANEPETRAGKLSRGFQLQSFLVSYLEDISHVHEKNLLDGFS